MSKILAHVRRFALKESLICYCGVYNCAKIVRSQIYIDSAAKIKPLAKFKMFTQLNLLNSQWLPDHKHHSPNVFKELRYKYQRKLQGTSFSGCFNVYARLTSLLVKVRFGHCKPLSNFTPEISDQVQNSLKAQAWNFTKKYNFGNSHIFLFMLILLSQ